WERSYRWVRRHRAVAALILVLAIGVPVLTAVWLRAERLAALERQRQELAKGRDYSDAEVRQAAAGIRRGLLDKLNATRAADGWLLCNLRPGAPPERETWSHAQGLCAVLGMPDADREELRKFLPGLGLLFAPGRRIESNGTAYGWPPHINVHYTQAEPAFWMAAALARALARPGLLTESERAKVLENYTATQEIIRTYRPDHFTGGWHMVPHPQDPEAFTIYASALGLFALLEAKAANLPWEGSTAKRDEYLKKTADWLINELDPKMKPPGWDLDNKAVDRVLEGQTLQIYALLLRAELEADIKLPAAMLEAIPHHLLQCCGRSVDSNDTSAYSSYLFRDHNGKEQVAKQN